MAGSLKDQLLRKGLAKEAVDPRIEAAKKHAAEVQARLDDETLVPAFEAAATGRIVDKPSTVTRADAEDARASEADEGDDKP